jgi:hypothetical protein
LGRLREKPDPLRTMMDTEDTRAGEYKAYLVRLWRDTPDTEWRASAQSVRTGNIVRFANVEALCVFLHVRSQGPAPDDERGSIDA